MRLKRLFTTIALLFSLTSRLALAHATSDTYMRLELTGHRLTGFWNVALRDLDYVLKIDLNHDRIVTDAELAASRTRIERYSLKRLEVSADGQSCSVQSSSFEPTETGKGAYVSLGLAVNCPAASQEVASRQIVLRQLEIRQLVVVQTLFLDGGVANQTGSHRGFLSLIADGQEFTGVFTPDDTQERFTVASPNPLGQLLEFVWQGMTHIWGGFDHILFLLSLLLPSVMRRDGNRWQPVSSFREALSSVLKVVTAFTVAHSVTLALSALELVRLSSRLVEATIAASVILAALNNVFPVVSERRRWMVAFAFGLIHGFGFSSVLSELVLDRRGLVSSLLGFNLGVEIGQLGIVIVFLPLAFLVRGSFGYRRYSLSLGSLVVAAVAGVWLAERLFDFKWLPI
jgi:HupE / UreJ protein